MGLFFLSFFGIYSIYFVKIRIPETKGLALERIEEQFDEIRNRGGIIARAEEEPLLAESHVEEEAESDVVNQSGA
jgi:hypothetical protein